VTDLYTALAATRRFTPGYSGRDLIRYVARIRAGTADRAGDMDLDPLATEAVFRRALGRSVPSVTDPWMRLRSTVALLTVLFSDLDLGGSHVDALLTEARGLADQWLSQKARALIARHAGTRRDRARLRGCWPAGERG
jgi:hypothetical protein